MKSYFKKWFMVFGLSELIQGAVHWVVGNQFIAVVHCALGSAAGFAAALLSTKKPKPEPIPAARVVCQTARVPFDREAN